MTCDLHQDCFSNSGNLQTELIGYSIIVQHEKDNKFITTGESIGISSSILLKLSEFGYYRIAVFPVIGLSFDHSFFKHSDMIFHERIYISNATNYEITDPIVYTIENDGK